MSDRLQQRWQVFFAGNVQGVGFRYTTRRIASGFAVTGFVRNCSDGRVELVVEGESAELQAFVGQIEAQMEGMIHDRLIDRRPATGEFHSFEIRI